MNKETFDKLFKGKKIPSFEELDKAFAIASISDENVSIRAVAKKIDDRMDDWFREVESWMHPDTSSLANLNECGYFDEKQKKQIMDLYRKLAFYKRYYHALELDYSDENAVKFINDLFPEWQNIKKRLLDLMKKVREHWKKEQPVKTKEDYLG
jgi:hypothetical protein